MHTVTWPASSAVWAGMHRTRATSGAASRVSSSKSSAVTARLRVRSISGPRTRASSTDSASTPPAAGWRFVTPRTNGIDDLSVRIERPATLPPAAAADGVVADADRRPRRRDRAVRTDRPVLEPHERRELDLARGGVEDHDLVARAAVGERVDQLPLLPALVGADLDHRRSDPWATSGPLASRKRWPGCPLDSPTCSRRRSRRAPTRPCRRP